MPFVKGGELYKIKEHFKRLPMNVIVFYSYQLVLALGYLHDKNYVHRDLKLENVMIQEDGYIKLIDFGLAKELKKDEKASSITGTCEYIAPEILNE